MPDASFSDIFIAIKMLWVFKKKKHNPLHKKRKITETELIGVITNKSQIPERRIAEKYSRITVALDNQHSSAERVTAMVMKGMVQ